MRTSSLLLCAATCLAGCVTTSPILDVNVNQVLGGRYVDKPFSDMVMRYGVPAREMKVSDRMVYSWDVAITRYFETTSPADLRCRLDAYVDDEEVTVAVGVYGNQGACVEFL